jgi:Ni/Co efflux regulator RcnB
MRKLGYVIAAMSAIALAAPSIANAETVVIKRDHVHRDHLDRDWHHAWHRDHGWRHHDKTVIIKNRRHEG